jgi:tRNA(fMet)-specific endonuclease VapC
MVLLDTDHISLLDRGGAEGARIRNRLRSVPPDDVATTIISYEEQMRGWLSRIAQAPTLERQVAAYGELKRQLRNYCDIAVVDFDEKAAAEFERLKKARIRIGTMDLKISAVALINNATLLSHNLADFGKVPGLRVEDWSV